MALTNLGLVAEHPHEFGGTQRLYRLPNGYGLSAVNSPMMHSYQFAWEVAVVSGMDEACTWDAIAYDTPLTDDVEVFGTDEEANAFIAEAFQWALDDAAAPERAPHSMFKDETMLLVVALAGWAAAAFLTIALITN